MEINAPYAPDASLPIHPAGVAVFQAPGL